MIAPDDDMYFDQRGYAETRLACGCQAWRQNDAHGGFLCDFHDRLARVVLAPELNPQHSEGTLQTPR